MKKFLFFLFIAGIAMVATPVAAQEVSYDIPPSYTPTLVTVPQSYTLLKDGIMMVNITCTDIPASGIITVTGPNVVFVEGTKSRGINYGIDTRAADVDDIHVKIKMTNGQYSPMMNFIFGEPTKVVKDHIAYTVKRSYAFKIDFINHKILLDTPPQSQNVVAMTH